MSGPEICSSTQSNGTAFPVHDRMSNREGAQAVSSGRAIAGTGDISRECFAVVRQEQAALTAITGLHHCDWRRIYLHDRSVSLPFHAGLQRHTATLICWR